MHASTHVLIHNKLSAEEINKPNIILLTGYSSKRISYWSGIPHFTRKMLDLRYNVVEINPGESWLTALANKLFRFYARLTGRIISLPHTKTMMHIARFLYRTRFRKELKSSRMVVCMSVCSEVAALPNDHRVIWFLDATYPLLLETYPDYQRTPPRARKIGTSIERQGMQRAVRLLFTSSWARNRAVDEYGLNQSKTRLVGFGSNLRDEFDDQDVARRIADKRINLFFNGTDWKRKGGTAALNLAEKLAATGQEVHLYLLGKSPKGLLAKGVKIHTIGWLDKANPAHVEQLIKLYKNAHFLILPTTADCTPVCISEAFCYALPVITRAVGGIPELLQNNTGYIIADNTIDQIIKDSKSSTYEAMAHRCRKEYELHYNWKNWLTVVSEQIDSVSNE